MPQYPSDAAPDVLIRARRFPIVEVSAGALLGLLPGMWIGGSYVLGGSGFGIFFLSVGLALLIGGLTGWAVGYFTGPTGAFTVGTVLAAVPRIIFGATIGLMFGMVFVVLGVVVILRRENDHD